MLEGVVSVTDTGVKIATFPSVPYAKPPVGKLRFKAPEPPEKWEGVRPADPTFNVCPQIEGGSEDCLYLNIVEPQDMGNNLSVIFWIHGGAFFIGSASLEYYNLDDFAKQGVVMVSTNYRLSALGFLSVNGTDVTPNAGLKDQIAALRWVQRNIASFSGNPNDVTIFGESAGGASVQYLITSPMAKGLFSKAIMMSGSACTNWAFREPNTEDAFLLGESLGKKTSDPQELVDFLRTVPSEDIIDKVLDQWYTRKKEKRLKSINAQTISYLPTLEYPVRAGDSFEEVFLPDRPATILEQGNFHKVPQIIGMNSLEASTLTEVPHTDEWPQVESNWESLVPEDMRLQKGSPASKHVAARIKEFYFKNQALDDHAAQQYLECSSDADWTRCTTECAKYTAKHIPGQLWAYYFTYFTPNSFTCNLQNCELISGAAHFDDVPLMYKEHPLASEYTPDDEIVHSRFLKMWTNFARTGSCCSVWTGPMGSTPSEALDRLAGGSWMLFLVLSPLLSWAVLFYALYTRYYWLALMYLAWMWLDRHTPYRGGRRMEWTRKLQLWRRAASYFPLRLVKTAELPPDRNYILAVYPHGVLSYGGFLGFCTDAVAVSEALPGVTARPFTLNVNFYMPFVRDFLMALGFCSVSAESLGFFLEDRKGGNALGLVAGGAAEALLSEPGAYRLMANRRKGIVRLAIKHGAHLVPVLSLGEPELYDQVRSPWLQKIQQKIKDLTGVCPVVPIGWGLLQDRFGILPRRRPITVLVGKPIEVEAVEEPTSQQVDQLHVEFIRQLVELFESHKHKYVDDADNVHLTFA